MKKTMKVLICIDWFLPAYKAGGPIQSISNLVNHLKDEFDIFIATSNTDLGERLDLGTALLNTWLTKDGYKIIYLDQQHQNLKFYKAIFIPQNFDVVYFNSLFSFKFTLLPLLIFKEIKMRRVLAPRGMLGEGALAIKPFKKRVFLKLFRLFQLHEKVIWHATANSEVKEIIAHFGKRKELILAPNLSAKIDTKYHPKKKVQNRIKIFFLSRIAIKKNLIGAISYLSKIDKSYKVEFTIIGPVDEEKYWKKCKYEIDKLSQNIEVIILGAVPNHKLAAILDEQHILLLPTHHENFGHVIMESWQRGCPVVISDKTPWRNLRKKHLGFDISLNNSTDFINAIELFSMMNENTYNEWSKSAFNYAKAFTENVSLLEQNKALFLNAVNDNR